MLPITDDYVALYGNRHPAAVEFTKAIYLGDVESAILSTKEAFELDDVELIRLTAALAGWPRPDDRQAVVGEAAERAWREKQERRLQRERDLLEDDDGSGVVE